MCVRAESSVDSDVATMRAIMVAFTLALATAASASKYYVMGVSEKVLFCGVYERARLPSMIRSPSPGLRSCSRALSPHFIVKYVNYVIRIDFEQSLRM